MENDFSIYICTEAAKHVSDDNTATVLSSRSHLTLEQLAYL